MTAQFVSVKATEPDGRPAMVVKNGENVIVDGEPIQGII